MRQAANTGAFSLAEHVLKTQSCITIHCLLPLPSPWPEYTAALALKRRINERLPRVTTIDSAVSAASGWRKRRVPSVVPPAQAPALRSAPTTMSAQADVHRTRLPRFAPVWRAVVRARLQHRRIHARVVLSDVLRCLGRRERHEALELARSVEAREMIDRHDRDQGIA